MTFKNIVLVVLVASLTQHSYGFVNALWNATRPLFSNRTTQFDHAHMKRKAAEVVPYIEVLSEVELAAFQHSCKHIALMVKDSEKRRQVACYLDKNAFELYKQTSLKNELDSFDLEIESLGRVLDLLDVVHKFAPLIPYTFSKNHKLMIQKVNPLIRGIKEAGALNDYVLKKDDISDQDKMQLNYALFIRQIVLMQKIQQIEKHGVPLADWNRWSDLSGTYFSAFENMVSLKACASEDEYKQLNEQTDVTWKHVNYVEQQESHAGIILDSVNAQVGKEIGQVERLKNVVGEVSNQDELKKQYRKWALENHPDKTGDAETFTALNELYQRYKDNPCPDELDAWIKKGKAYQEDSENKFNYSRGYALFHTDRRYVDDFLRRSRKLDDSVLNWLNSHPLMSRHTNMEDHCKETIHRATLFDDGDN